MTSTTKHSIKVTEQSGVALVSLDTPDSSANVLTTALFAELEQTFSELQQRTDLNGMILSSAKPTIYVAGADLNRIVATLDWPDEKIIEFCNDGRAIMSRLSQMPFMTVAAIHGACVGGGLELALWCDRRVATNDRKTILGLPEVKLGLVPGWAGTVRLPRIADLESAVDLVTSGRVVKSERALAMGFVDEVSANNELIETAMAMIQVDEFESVQDARASVLDPVERVGKLDEIRQTYFDRIRSNKDIYPFACEVVLEHMLATADIGQDKACHSESLAMAKVYGSEASYGLLNNFFLGEHNKKNPGFVELELADKEIAAVGIIGTGLMGRSIAENCLRFGNHVVLIDADKTVLKRSADSLQDIAAANSVTCVGIDYDGLIDCDLVIESVVEVADVKKTVIQRIEQAVPSDTIIATNTSAIPLSKMAGVLKNPKRFCGIHFCHPELMQLVEVVRGERASDQTMANATSWVRRLRKMPVVVNDHAGFVVNRLLAALLDQAFRLYSWGFRIEEIDDAMREFGFLGGPFEIVDVIGAEVCMYAGREMYDGGVQCVTLSPILPRMVKKGWLGRRAKRGFYRYEQPESDRIWDPQIDELLASYVDQSGKPSFESAQIAESICCCIVLEASRILADGVVANAKDIDLCIINGFSFPKHLGGILFWADRKGIANVNSMLRHLAKFDAKLEPNKRLIQMENNETSFYN